MKITVHDMITGRVVLAKAVVGSVIWCSVAV
jgi:hypothetical protein